MEQALAEKMAAETGVRLEQIVREEWEIILLKELFESPVGGDIIFRGGTALRLCFSSPRFSDDLDFSEIKAIPTDKFNKVIKDIAGKYPALSLSDLWSKHFTHLAEFKVKENWLPQPFRIKIEIRKGGTKEKEFELRLVSSGTTPLQAFGNTATLQQIFREKLLAAKARKTARDIFDLWFIGQKLKTEVNTANYDFDRRAMRGELRKYLPRKYWKVIESL